MFDFLHKKAKDAVPPTLPEGTVRRRYSIEGQVQGVGFRITGIRQKDLPPDPWERGFAVRGY